MRLPIILTTLLIMLTGSFVVFGNESFRARQHVTQKNTYKNDDIRLEVRLGREISAQILSRYGLLENDELQRYVSLVGRSVSNFSTRSDLKFYFAVLDGPEVNAFSAPGGYIFITTGAISKLNSEAELAAILAHEIAHIDLRHIVKSLNIKAVENNAMTGLSKLLGGFTDTANKLFSQAVNDATQILFSSGFKKQDELAADQHALFLLAASSYDPREMVSLLSRLNDEFETNKVKGMTHPPDDERINKIALKLRAYQTNFTSFFRKKERFSRYSSHVTQ